MKGDVVAQGLLVNADVAPKDIFSNLDIGGMLFFEAYNPKWAIILDGSYMDLSQKGQTPLRVVTQQLAWIN